MDPGEQGRLGDACYARAFTRLCRMQTSKAPIVGFDTEYDARTGALLSVQLSWQGNTLFIPWSGRIDPAELAAHVWRLLGAKVPKVELASYFALAELQHLPVWCDGWSYREYSGSFECSFTVAGRTLSVYDVARWYPGPGGLAAAARTIGEEKRTWDRAAVSAADLERPGFAEYAVHDAVLAERLLLSLREAWRAEGVDVLVYRTPAGASAAAVRRLLPADIAPPPTRARTIALAGGWGGRAEAFARGRWPAVSEYDLTSAYPHALVGLGRLPGGADWRCGTTWRECRGRRGYAAVTFAFPQRTAIPCLPVFAAGALIYPLAGSTTATLDEVQVARELGARLELREAWYYTDGSTWLCEWMADRLRRREAATDTMARYVLKLQANALIGKLAQRHRDVSLETLRIASVELDIPLALLVRLDRADKELLGLREPDRLGGSWWPEVNGLVTGAVRARLSALAAAHAPVYVATDSLWTTSSLPSSVLPADLGLKRQGPGQVWRTRLARIQEPEAAHVVHHAWASRKAAAAAMDGGPLTYTIRRPIHARESLRHNRPLGVFVDETRAGSLGWCGKRRLHRDGSSSPWPTIEEFTDARRSQASRDARAGRT